MKTIPFEPLLQCERLQALGPDIQAFIYKAVFLLARERKLVSLPNDLRLYFHCSQSTYKRYKDTFREILCELAPEICKIKQQADYRALRMRVNRSKRIATDKKINNKNTTFSDESDTHLEIIPIQIPREKWNTGKTDHVERQKAIDSNKQVDDKTWFTDN